MEEIRVYDELQTPFQPQQGGSKSAHFTVYRSPPSPHPHAAGPNDEPVSRNRGAPPIIEHEFVSPRGSVALTIEGEANLRHRGECSNFGSHSIICASLHRPVDCLTAQMFACGD